MGATSSRYGEYATRVSAEAYQGANGSNEAMMETIMQSIDPYKVLKLEKGFTKEELTSAFKKAALLAHPDRGGSEEVFLIVKECFRKLSYELNARESDRPHHELKSASKAYQSGQGTNANTFGYEERPRMHGIDDGFAEEPDGPESGDFNQRFNRLFERSKLKDDDDDNARGYGDMMAPSTGKREEINIPKTLKTFNKTTFNKTFDDTTLADTKEVIVYREPEPMNLSKRLAFTELGATQTGDFSKEEAPKRGGLLYTDFKKAYTTTRLVDPRAVAERKKYRNVDEFEKDWAAASVKRLTPEEIEYQAKKIEVEERVEVDRLRRLKEKDRREEEHYNSIKGRLLRR
jgi:curved DNA-binding protein CbpA